MGDTKILAIRELKDSKPVKIVQREIYLTFDDGIQAGTEEVLQLLKEKGIKGTFMVCLFLLSRKSKKDFAGYL